MSKDKVKPIQERLNAAVSAVLEARKKLNKLQNKFAPIQHEWKECDLVDDLLHDALEALGE